MHPSEDNARSRREFLKASGALIIALPGLAHAAPEADGAAPSSGTVATAAGTAGARPPLAPNELDSWLAVLPDGTVNAFFGKIDSGHSLEVAIAQIVADELDVSVEKVRVFSGDTGTSCNQGGASGSLGINRGARPLRHAAAEARRLLVARAAQALAVPAEGLQVQDGLVFVKAEPGRQVSYAELIGGQYFNSRVEWNKQVGNFMDIQVAAKPKAPADYKIVGQSVRRRDVADKVYGTATFVTDIVRPGMLHARVIRPAHAGAQILEVDEASVAAIPGVEVVRDRNFLAVLAPREWDAVRAAETLKVRWTPPQDVFPGSDGLHEYIRHAPVVRRQEATRRGDLEGPFKTARRVIELEYEWPLQSHASMGPACAVADVQADSATVWTGSQKPHYVRDGVASLLNMPAEKVRSIWVTGPGSYGRNDAGDAALAAAWLSQRVGKPVRVQGMRADGTGWDPKGAALVIRGRAALDAQNRVSAYEVVCRGLSRVNITTNEADPRDSLVGMAIGLPPKPELGLNTPSEDYTFQNKLLAMEVVPPLLESSSPLRTAHLRDPLGPETHFGSEQFIDELAVAAGEDAVVFRLRHLNDPRHIAVIRAAAERAGWQTRVSGSRPRHGEVLGGRGIAYANRGGTLVATVAEVEVNVRTGRVWARKFTVAHDCGLIINPMGVRYTIEGNVTQGLSRTLFEEVKFDARNVLSTDWVSYPILEIEDAPEQIDCVLINRPEIEPTGAGEPSIRTIPAAVANAFFDATGVRMRRVPLTPERVRQALERA
jgi:CO/xanthine dehydrogenase Mo-binding subunit